MSDIVNCPQCALSIHRAFKFCPNCGAEQPSPPETAAPTAANGRPSDAVAAEAKFDTTSIYAGASALGALLILVGGVMVFSAFSGSMSDEVVIIGAVCACGGLGMVLVSAPSLVALKSASANAVPQHKGDASAPANVSPSAAVATTMTVAGGIAGAVGGVVLGIVMCFAFMLFSIVNCLCGKN